MEKEKTNRNIQNIDILNFLTSMNLVFVLVLVFVVSIASLSNPGTSAASSSQFMYSAQLIHSGILS